MRFRLLGPFEIEASEPVTIPRRRERCLLAVLLLEQGRSVSTDRLADLLWDGDPPPAASTTLRSHVSRLRATLQSGVEILKQGPGYLLRTDPERIDAHQFRSMVSAARALVDVERRADMLRAALDLWRGPVLADLATGMIRERLGAGLEELRLETLDQRVSDDLAIGRHRDLIAELREIVAAQPNRERFTGHLMLALYRSGRQADALAVYEENRRVLADELGLNPGNDLRALHEQILRADRALDLRAPVKARTLRQLPHDIAHFSGRDRELAHLDSVAFDRRTNPAAPAIVSIDGAPGTGKTTLAVHWAHRIADRFPDVQLHLNLRGYGRGEPVTPGTAAETLLRGLGVDSELIPASVDERSALLRSTLAGRQVLMLLDNARDADQVRPLLPGTGSLVIVTSRNQLRGLSIRDGAHRVTLHRLPADQAVELLTASVGQNRISSEPAAAARLVELCDHLPLAIAIVAERADRSAWLAEVVHALEDEKARLDNLGTGEDDDLRAALSWSYGALDDDAATMFRMLGLHPADDIGVEAAAALVNLPVARAKESLDKLLAAHLVEQRLPHRYELHDLMRLYATEAAHRYSSASDRSLAIRRVLDWYLHAAASADTALYRHRRRDFLQPYAPQSPPPVFASPHAATVWLEQEYACIRSVAEWAASNGFVGYTWRMALSLITFIDRSIPWHDGLELLSSTYKAAEAANDTLGYAYALNALSSLLSNKGDLQSAVSYIELALKGFQDISYVRGEAMALGNLGLLHGELGHHDEARSLATRALQLCSELGYERGTALNLDNLGVALTVNGDYAQAKECHLQAAVIFSTLGDTAADAMNQHHLGWALGGLGDVKGASRAFRTSIAIYRGLSSRRWAAIVLADFGKMLVDAGHPRMARDMLASALVTMREFADPRVQEIEAALGNLAG